MSEHSEGFQAFWQEYQQLNKRDDGGLIGWLCRLFEYARDNNVVIPQFIWYPMVMDVNQRPPGSVDPGRTTLRGLETVGVLRETIDVLTFPLTTAPCQAYDTCFKLLQRWLKGA